MSIPTHTLAGVLIAQHIRNPFWAFVAGIVGHYILDMIPHGDEELGTWAKTKNTVSRGFFLLWLNLVIASLFVLNIVIHAELPHPAALSAAVLGSLLPDILWYVYDIYKLTVVRKLPWLRPFFQRVVKLEPFLEHHNRIHHWIHTRINRRITQGQGVFVELGLSLFFLFEGLRFGR